LCITKWIRTYSGLSDAAIERILFPPDLNSVATGRTFNRWATGARSMDHDSLQLMVRNAIAAGLLPKYLHGTKTIITPIEARLKVATSERPIEQLKTRAKLIRELHIAKRKASAALQGYATAAKNADYVAIFDPSQPDGKDEVHASTLEKLSEDIANHYFLPLDG
jgi:hypothetical protein